MHNFCNLTVPSACKRVFLAVLCKKKRKKAIVFAFLHQRWLHVGAADEARTRYLHLGKVALYQMSYGRILIMLTHYRGPRKDLRSKGLWGKGESLALITAVLLARLLDKPQDFRRGASDRNRTNDTGIFSPLLYRLSYRGISGAIIPAPSHSYFKRGPRESLRSKILWGRGESLAFITAVLLARPPDELQDFRRSDPDRARTDDPQRDRLVL